MAEQRERLQELENLIANLGTGDETITDQAFEDRLKETEKDVMDLLRDAQSIKGRSVPQRSPFPAWCCSSECAFN